MAKKPKTVDVLLRRESESLWSAESISERGDAFLQQHVANWNGSPGPYVFKDENPTPIGRFAMMLDTERVGWDLVG